MQGLRGIKTEAGAEIEYEGKDTGYEQANERGENTKVVFGSLKRISGDALKGK